MGKVKIDGFKKDDKDLTYEELVFLCDEFVKNKQHIPYNCEFNSKWNLPTLTATKQILSKKEISFDDFLRRYEDVKPTCFNIEEYNEYVDKYKHYSQIMRHPLGVKEVTQYDLPCAEWFIVHCPNSNVRMWNDFVAWCGFKQNKRVSKDVAEKILKDYDMKTDRPIILDDLCKIGISKSTIEKYWGSFSKCKQALGLKLTPSGGNKKSFENYKNRLDNVIDDCKKQGKLRITWDDILHNKYGGFNYNSLKNAFTEKNMNVVNYIQDNGLSFWKSGHGKENYYVFPDGESISSSYEYDLSSFLKSINLVFDRDYTRNVLYKDIISDDLQNKIDCDYLFYDALVIEVAGLITNTFGDWHTYNFKSKREQEYAEKMIWKERLLRENNIPFLFLFPEDFQNDCAYQPKVIDFILSNLYRYQFVKKINTAS